MDDKTVLICDDNPVMHDSLKVYLQQERINVVSRYDGESALE